MKLCKDTKKDLLKLAQEKNIHLEGNILKVIDTEGEDPDFVNYIKTSTDKDKSSRKKRLEITKQIQSQNKELTSAAEERENLMNDIKNAFEESEKSKELIEYQNKELTEWKEENERISEELRKALSDAELSKKDAITAKETAEYDLDILQKRKETELISNIVKVALMLIVGAGIATTALYITALLTGKDTYIIGPAWSNTLSILITNAFSIIGTIVGVKYASGKNKF